MLHSVLWLIESVHDQRGIVRGYVKYTNEMRFGANVPQLVLRSLQIAKSAPSGPVYLMGAREVMESTQPHLDLEKIQPHKWKPLGRIALADEVR
jgi:acetolactate synthase I/II/III large subunit